MSKQYTRKIIGRNLLGALEYDGTQEMLDEDMKAAGFREDDSGYFKAEVYKVAVTQPQLNKDKQ